MFEAVTLSQIISISSIAFFTSAITSLIGAGGGTILLLFMLYVLPAPSVIPVHGCIQLVSNTTRVYLLWPYMQWGIILRFLALMPLGVYLGLLLYNALEPRYIQLLIAGSILLSLFLNPAKSSVKSKFPKSAYYLVGLVIGFGNMIVGVLAPLLAAVLRLENLPKEETVGTLGFFGFAGNLLKIAGFAAIGFSFAAYLPIIIPACLASIGGSIVGKALLIRSTNRFFTTAFKVVIFLLAVKLIADVVI